jgi:hypothetical protein
MREEQQEERPVYRDRAHWALEAALVLAHEHTGPDRDRRNRVVDGLQRALRQLHQREALLETLLELRWELDRLRALLKEKGGTP